MGKEPEAEPVIRFLNEDGTVDESQELLILKELEKVFAGAVDAAKRLQEFNRAENLQIKEDEVGVKFVVAEQDKLVADLTRPDIVGEFRKLARAGNFLAAFNFLEANMYGEIFSCNELADHMGPLSITDAVLLAYKDHQYNPGGLNLEQFHLIFFEFINTSVLRMVEKLYPLIERAFSNFTLIEFKTKAAAKSMVRLALVRAFASVAQQAICKTVGNDALTIFSRSYGREDFHQDGIHFPITGVREPDGELYDRKFTRLIIPLDVSLRGEDSVTIRDPLHLQETRNQPGTMMVLGREFYDKGPYMNVYL